MKKTFRIIATLYFILFAAYCFYMALTAFNGGYIAKEQNHITIAGGIVAVVLAVTNAILSRKK